MNSQATSERPRGLSLHAKILLGLIVGATPVCLPIILAKSIPAMPHSRRLIKTPMVCSDRWNGGPRRSLIPSAVSSCDLY